MIRILDEQFQKKVRGGLLALDRAAVITMALSVREDLVSTPMIRCDVAYGTENATGEFDPWDYNNSVATIPIFIEGPERFGNCLRAGHKRGPTETGSDMVHGLLSWMEERLVADGYFGPNAELDEQKPNALKKAEVEK